MTTQDAGLGERIEDILREDQGVDTDAINGVWVHDGRVVVEAAFGRLDSEPDDGQAVVTDTVESVTGVETVHVEPARASTTSLVAASEVDPVIAVASAKGGVGKTTVAAGIACGLATDRQIALFDSDLYGPNLPSVLDVHGPVRSNDNGDPLPLTVGSLELMSVRFMTSGGPLAWRGSVAHDALTDMFESTRWADPEAMIVDLPPGTGDVVLTMLQEAPIDGVVFVTTPSRTSVEDTQRSVALFQEHGIPVIGGVVNMAQFVCPSCGDSHDLFTDGDLQAQFDIPILGRLPFTSDVQERLRPGDVPEPMRTLGEEVAAQALTESG